MKKVVQYRMSPDTDDTVMARTSSRNEPRVDTDCSSQELHVSSSRDHLEGFSMTFWVSHVLMTRVPEFGRLA